MLFEVRIMKMCKHPNIVKFIGAWLKEDEIFVRAIIFVAKITVSLTDVRRLPWSFAKVGPFKISIKVSASIYLYILKINTMIID